jgi:mono/diheme cytochrome c family protein
MVMATMNCGLVAFLLAAIPVLEASAAQTPQTAESFVGGTTGAQLFKTYCSSCHGQSARGDGPLADSLRFRPADLTLIAKHSEGKFDDNKVYRIIDGREPVKGHGGTDMPVWGDAFKESVEGHSEKAVKARIDALVEHLKSIQAK